MSIALSVIAAGVVALTAAAAMFIRARSDAEDVAPAMVTIAALALATAALMLPNPAVPPADDRLPPPGTSQSEVEPAAGTGATLELLQLSEAFAGEHLQISGLVRNPVQASVRAWLTAVVVALDDRGSELATQLDDVDPLQPGGSATFTVTLPADMPTARLRIGFREGTTVVPHVDRRRRRPVGRLTANTTDVPLAGQS